jgi:hypothetical protein
MVGREIWSERWGRLGVSGCVGLILRLVEERRQGLQKRIINIISILQIPQSLQTSRYDRVHYILHILTMTLPKY